MGFGVWGLGFRVQGSGFGMDRVWGFRGEAEFLPKGVLRGGSSTKTQDTRRVPFVVKRGHPKS